MKLLPLRVNVNAPLPAITLSGERLDRVGCGLLTARVCAHTPPPGAGLTTEIEGNEAEATPAAGMAAGRWVARTKDVAQAGPRASPTTSRMKLLPLRATLNI